MLYSNYENFTASDSAYGNDGGNFRAVVQVSVATANTWTANTVLISSTPFDSYGVSLSVQHLFNLGTNFNRAAFEVYEGASGSEVKLIDTFTVKNHDDYEYSLPNNHIYYPIFLAAGKRITFRAKFDVRTTGSYAEMYMHFYRNKPMQTGWLGNKVTTYGYTEATTKGVDVTPNATANTWGSWTQITASTTRYHKAIIPMFFPVSNKTASTDRGYSYQIGIGGSGSESIISPILRQGCGPFVDYNPRLQPIYKDIPEGSRISVRCKSSTSSATPCSVIFQGIS
jgi:hypothetical protein